ncbi:MAG: sulfatase-like hydrolase/transferase [Bacteroidota bacterium]
MKKTIYYFSILLMVFTWSCKQEQPEKPNIIFIFADDQSYETIHALGNDEIITPNLDKLSEEGLTFTHTYNMGSWQGAVCIASRTMLNTGMFLWNARIELDGNKRLDHIEERGELWAQLMEEAGYETYVTGKWHVAASPQETFMTSSNIRHGMPKQTAAGYNRPLEGEEDPWSPYDTSFGGFWKGGTHWTKILGNTAVSYIDSASSKDSPFFMYLAFNAAHDPRQSPKEYVDKYPLENISLPENYLDEYPYKEEIGCGKKLRDERLAPFPRTPYAVKVNRQEYYALITYMDEQIGRIIEALKKSGKADNTYIFYAADHGLGIGHHGFMGKQNMYDHSVRVPMMIWGKGIPANKKIDIPVYLQDIMPSSLELAGRDIPDFVQFKSLMPLIKGENTDQYKAIYGAYQNKQRMVTKGAYKLIMYPTVPVARLYNLKDDPNEMNDLAGDPAYLPKMQELFSYFMELQEDTGDTLNLKTIYPQLIAN